MSGYLWGIAQLVNDPKRVFRQQPPSEGVNTRSQEDARAEVLPEKNIFARAPQTSGIKTNGVTKFETKDIQVGQPAADTHVSIQCSHCPYSCVRKTTSVQHNRVPLFNRGIGTFRTSTVDACTEPIEKKICKQHKEAISMLENWSGQNFDKADLNLITQLKNWIMDLINLLKIEKIQNIPPYYVPEKRIVKLYREASCSKLRKRKTE